MLWRRPKRKSLSLTGGEFQGVFRVRIHDVEDFVELEVCLLSVPKWDNKDTTLIAQ